MGELGVGNGADINIQMRSLSLADGAEVQALTRGKGNAGNIQVNALDSVNLSGVNLSGIIIPGLNLSGIDPSLLSPSVFLLLFHLDTLAGFILALRKKPVVKVVKSD